MPYIVDANVLIRAYAPLDPKDENYEKWRVQQTEALRAIERLKQDRQETLYHTKEIRREVWKGVQRPIEKGGRGLTREEATALLRDIGKNTDIEKLEKHLTRLILEKSKEERYEFIKQRQEALNDALKKARQTLEEAKDRGEISEKDLKRASGDLIHVATAKIHNLQVLTSNTKDFELHENLKIRHPRVVAIELEPESVRSFRPIQNLGGDAYRKTQTYEVVLSSGKIAQLNIKGLIEGKDLPKNERYKKDNVRDIIYHPEVIKLLEKWEPGSKRPVRIEIRNASVKNNQAVDKAVPEVRLKKDLIKRLIRLVAETLKEEWQEKQREKEPTFRFVLKLGEEKYAVYITTKNEEVAKAKFKYIQQIRKDMIDEGTRDYLRRIGIDVFKIEDWETDQKREGVMQKKGLEIKR